MPRVAKNCRDGIRKTKAENKLRLARNFKSNKRAFFRYVDSKRQRKETVAQLLGMDGKMITNDIENAEVLNSNFSSVFSEKTVYDPPGKCEVQKEG